MRTLAIRLSACAIAAACALASPPPAGAAQRATRGGAHVSEQVASLRVKRLVPEARTVSCRAARSRRWRCRWTGTRRVNGAEHSCRGVQSVRRSGRRWRARSLSRSCTVTTAPASVRPPAPKPPAPKPGKPTPVPPPVPPAVPPPPTLPGAPHFGFSENVDSRLSPEKHADLALQAGADSQRLTLGWRWTEPYRDDYRFESFDQVYRASLARGIRPLISVMFAPWWTWSPEIRCDRFGAQCTYPPERAFDGEWREFLAIVAKRYPKALGIEIWNEPNLRSFWKPSPDVARYTELLKQAYTAIKAVSPSMPVITGGFANAGTTEDGTVSLADFTRGVYERGGKSYMDGIGFHPYGAMPGRGDFIQRSFDRVRAVRNSFGDRSKPLWATEFGLTTTGNPWPNVWTEQQQAEGLALHYKTIAAMPDVAGIYLHTLLEPEGDRGGDGPGFGVVRGNGQPKPAFCAVALARAVGPGCTPH